MMAVLVEGDGIKKIYVKGAPETILEICSTIWDEENNIPLNHEMINRLQQEEVFMATRALRLLAFAVIENPTIDLTGGWEPLKGHACFLGITGQFDPPRPEVKAAVHACRSSGIRPIIVTGDHKITGLAVAKMLNIAKEGEIAIDGQELSLISDEDLNTTPSDFGLCTCSSRSKTSNYKSLAAK
jgi:Ca2+-transporting ATPase